MLPHRGGGERDVVHQVPEPGREMDAHVAGVCARPSVLRRPASGPFALKSLRPARCSETAPSLSTGGLPQGSGPLPCGLHPLQAEAGGGLSRVDSWGFAHCSTHARPGAQSPG